MPKREEHLVVIHTTFSAGILCYQKFFGSHLDQQLIMKRDSSLWEFVVLLVKEFKNELKWMFKNIFLLEFKSKFQARQDGSTGESPERGNGEEKDDTYSNIIV